ncbi:MAG: DUF692 family protein [Anaerolineaceae bacterium]|nr:DUF692 family protein [Anaerolineaceae bacterium]
MSTKLFCDHSPGLVHLFQTQQVSLDGVEFNPFTSPEKIAALRADYPGLPFIFHASNVGRVPFSLQKLARYNRACRESAWISIHLSLVPSLVLFAAFRTGLKLPLAAPHRLESRFIRQVRRLQGKVELPLILENMPATPLLDNGFESAPAAIRRIISTLDTGVLLDLAHARVAAEFQGMTVEAYLLEMPLEGVREIHISGVREVDGALRDAHEPLQEVDYGILEWVLRRIKPEVVTLEYFRDDQAALKEMLIRLRQCLDVCSPTE